MPKKYLYLYTLMLPILLLQPLTSSKQSIHASQATPVTTCSSEATPTAPHFATPRSAVTPISSATPGGASSEFDPVYVNLMITQQERVLAMARLGAVYSQQKELQQLSETIIAGTEAILDQLKSAGALIAMPDYSNTELMTWLDEFGRQMVGFGGVPGAMEIVGGGDVLPAMCAALYRFDQVYVNALIEQLDAGIVLSQVARDLSSNESVAHLATAIIKADQPFEDGAIAIRDGILGATPVASPASGGL